MKLFFTKMSGAGNDFVVFDNRDGRVSLFPERIARLCHRQFGIGADGLLAVELGERGADFRMRYYNSDGSEAEMCGNGARCFARFVRQFLPPNASEVSFLTQAGVIRARYVENGIAITLTPPRELALARSVSLQQGKTEIHCVNTGVPHAVLFVDNIDHASVAALGREVRYHEAFAPKGTNVNFVQVTGPDTIRVRTYERGVEAETLACGTGVTASAILAHWVKEVKTPVRVRVQSGDELRVQFEGGIQNIHNVILQGPAQIVFTGDIEL